MRNRLTSDPTRFLRLRAALTRFHGPRAPGRPAKQVPTPERRMAPRQLGSEHPCPWCCRRRSDRRRAHVTTGVQRFRPSVGDDHRPTPPADLSAGRPPLALVIAIDRSGLEHPAPCSAPPSPTAGGAGGDRERCAARRRCARTRRCLGGHGRRTRAGIGQRARRLCPGAGAGQERRERDGARAGALTRARGRRTRHGDRG